MTQPFKAARAIASNKDFGHSGKAVALVWGRTSAQIVTQTLPALVTYDGELISLGLTLII